MQNAKNYFGEFLLLSSEHLIFIAQNLNIFAIFRQKESEGRRERDRALGEVGWRNFQSGENSFFVANGVGMTVEVELVPVFYVFSLVYLCFSSLFLTPLT